MVIDTAPVAYKRKISVNRSLTVYLFGRVVPYSSEVQQPMRATAVMSGHPHTRWSAPVDREQVRASSLHPDAQHHPTADKQRRSSDPLPS